MEHGLCRAMLWVEGEGKKQRARNPMAVTLSRTRTSNGPGLWCLRHTWQVTQMHALQPFIRSYIRLEDPHDIQKTVNHHSLPIFTSKFRLTKDQLIPSRLQRTNTHQMARTFVRTMSSTPICKPSPAIFAAVELQGACPLSNATSTGDVTQPLTCVESGTLSTSR